MTDNPQLQIEVCGVKVMRSHDYCHFEVSLSSSRVTDKITPQDVDELRKTAARLADKAVEQYKAAKLANERKHQSEYFIHENRESMEAIRALPETERTPGQQADLKAYDDAVFHLNRQYDYQDDWQD